MSLPTQDHMPRVALDEMNQTHEEELVLIHALAQQLANSESTMTDVQAAADAWFSHTQAHFANEERIMQQVSFPAYRMHKAEHDRVLELVAQLMAQLAEGNRDPLYHFIMDEWPVWFDRHVRSMDTATALFAQQGHF